MANTLTKFGVPLQNGGGRGGLLSPKLKYRFRVRFINFGPIAGGLELTQQVVTCDKPTVTFQEVSLHSYNSTAYIQGKHEWATINMGLRDDITNNISRLVGHQNQKQLNHFEQTSFASGINYKFTTFIEVLDGGNDAVLESWILEGCFLTSINYGSLDYSSSDQQMIDLTIRYDNAKQADGLMTRLPQLIGGQTVG
jgi:hypothetical protein